MTIQPKFIQIADDLALQDAMPADDLYHLDHIVAQVLTILEFAPSSELSIVIANDELVHELNTKHRGIDKTTDVLSFAADPLPPEIAAHETPYLGDLIIAYQYTLQQAAEHNHRPQDEFALLVVHGMLHLVGYNHDTQAAQADMWGQQAAILQQLKIDITVPDFIHSEYD